MKCIICHGEEVRERKVKEELKIGTNIVFVPVRALVCQACGERYYDRRTVRYLEQIEAKLKSGKIDLHEIGKVLVVEK